MVRFPKISFSKYSKNFIFQGLLSFIASRDRTNGEIESIRNPGNTECVDAATANWTQLQTNVGAQIALCGSLHLDTMYNSVRSYHTFINENRQLKFDAQNIVLQSLSEVKIYFE
jgi:hypothetical protein